MLLHEFNWKKEVLQASEPVLVDFWASWCPPCRAMNPTIEALARDFKVCKVNVDTNQELAAHYGISSIPALLIFKDGKIAARHVGVTPEATLAGRDAEVESAMNDHAGFGWMLLVLGLVIAGVGLVWILAPSIPWLGRLPGDIRIERENFRFYFPLVTCLLLSLVLSLVCGCGWSGMSGLFAARG